VFTDAIPETIADVATDLPSTENSTDPVGTGPSLASTVTASVTLVARRSFCDAAGAVNFTIAAAFTVMETLMGPAAA